jgi:acyl dehydratase
VLYAPHYFEDLREGMEFDSEWSKSITLTSLENYAKETGDCLHEPKQVGSEMKILVQGNWVTGLTGGILFDAFHFKTTILLQTKKVINYVGPVYVGDRIRAWEQVIALRDKPGKSYGIVTLWRKTFNEAGDVVQEIPEQEYLIRKRTA